MDNLREILLIVSLGLLVCFILPRLIYLSVKWGVFGYLQGKKLHEEEQKETKK